MAAPQFVKDPASINVRAEHWYRPLLQSVTGMLTQGEGGRGGRPATLASRFNSIPTHFSLDLHGF